VGGLEQRPTFHLLREDQRLNGYMLGRCLQLEQQLQRVSREYLGAQLNNNNSTSSFNAPSFSICAVWIALIYDCTLLSSKEPTMLCYEEWRALWMDISVAYSRLCVVLRSSCFACAHCCAHMV
jgi:hypothetical protein